jgi:hypothetical protein
MLTSDPQTRSRAVSAIVLILVGLFAAGLYRLVSGTERHSWSPGAVVPSTVAVTMNETYELAVPGGVSAWQKHGLNPSAIGCQWSTAGSGQTTLVVTAYGANTKATNAIASFTSPVTGSIHIDCSGWGAVFVDDADGAPGDSAGWFLVLAAIALTVGAGLGLSAMRMAHGGRERDSAGSSEDEQIQALVHSVRVRAGDDEVAGSDRGDIAP